MPADPIVYLADGTTTVGIGQQNGVTSGTLTRFIGGSIDWGSVVNEVQGHPAPYGKGFVRTGSAMTESRIIQGVIYSVWNAADPERNLLDEVNEDLPELFAPGRGAWELRVDRTNSAGGTNSRVLTVDTVELPGVMGPEDIHYNGSYGWTAFPFTLEAAFPLWRDRTATETAEITVANADADETETKAWSSVVNSGMEACGLKLKFTEDSAGDTTSITIVCTQFGETCVWTKATTFAADEYVDFFVGSPQVVTYTSGTAIGPTSSMGLARGTNSGTIKGTGANSLAFKCKLSYVQFWKGF